MLSINDDAKAFPFGTRMRKSPADKRTLLEMKMNICQPHQVQQSVRVYWYPPPLPHQVVIMVVMVLVVLVSTLYPLLNLNSILDHFNISITYI